jgi:ribonuclease HII
MTLVIGADEAGYGPNLGPLVVAATAWQVDAVVDDVEKRFTAVAAADGLAGLWGDSKQIYKGGAGLAALERGALTGIAIASGSTPTRWRELAPVVGCPQDVELPERGSLHAITLPVTAKHEAGLPAACRAALAAHGVTLAAVRCTMVPPAAFNRLLDSGLNKSDLLSQVTLDLAAGLVTNAGPTVVWCDRHGGRKRYAPLVARHFSAPLVQAREETAGRSTYVVPAANLRVEFSVGGESRTPVALASMTAKYVRELAMLALNDHWGRLAPGLEPTAGYPVDAARWRRAAAAAVEQAGIDWDVVWRRA